MHLDSETRKKFEAILNQKEELKAAQETLKESVMDHVVIGDGAFVSLRDRGAFREESGMSQAAESYGAKESPKAGQEVAPRTSRSRSRDGMGF